MSLQIDLRVVELLASRLCHDLVSPIGAVNNGLELLEEDPDPDLIPDAVSLASGSARQASAVVQFFRIAYGRGGRWVDDNSQDLRQLAADYLKPLKTELDWRLDGLVAQAPAGSGKLLLNMVALAAETLPRGGAITVSVPNDEMVLSVAASGERAALRPESRAALGDSIDLDELTPRSVQAYFTRVLAQTLGSDLELSEADSRILQTVRLV